MDILQKIVAGLRPGLEARKQETPLPRLLEQVAVTPRAPSFAGALRDGRNAGTPRVIAELKKASPSAGVIRADFEPLRLAAELEGAGAAALSVLTEPNFFLGDLAFLRGISATAKIPLLRKDFIFDEYQLAEARVAGAAAALLIARLLDDERLRALLSVARGLGLDALCEVHSEEELGRALDAGAEIVGVNCRDLRTFSLDLEVTRRLVGKIPAGKIVVAESGLRTGADLRALQASGADGFLVGTTLMRAGDVGEALREMIG